MLIGVVASLAGGLFFAVGSVMQQRMASERPEGESLSPKLLWHLLHSRMWLAGIGAGVVSYVLQALALATAPLSIVQPLFVSEVLFAIPLSVRLHGTKLTWREWLGVLAVAGGLAGAIVAAAPSKGHPLAPLTEWGILLGVTVAVGGAATSLGRTLSGPARASTLAFAAALAMGLEAALMAATTKLFAKGIVHMLASWQPYAMVVSSITGLFLIQSAFHDGPLAASMPVADGTEPLVAIAIGVSMFGERVHTAPLRLGITAFGLVCLLAGIVVLDTSGVVASLHERQG